MALSPEAISRALPEDDEGEDVCTVRGSQQFTFYGGITRFHVTATYLDCEYDQEAAQKLGGVRRVRILFSIDQPAWAQLPEALDYIFDGSAAYERASD